MKQKDKIEYVNKYFQKLQEFLVLQACRMQITLNYKKIE